MEINNDKKKAAEGLLDIKAVFLRVNEPFTWASGIKSPIYCDNRLILTAPKVREMIEKQIVDNIRRYYPDVEVLMGTSTAGIPHAAIAAAQMNLPMGYVRSGAKDHGRGNRIEGRLDQGAKTVVVEDLISTAGSCVEVVEALREAGADVLGVVSIFTYGMERGKKRLADAKVENHSVTDLDTLLEVACERGDITEEESQRVKKFISNPADESWIK